jgi:hypothetical protein
MTTNGASGSDVSALMVRLTAELGDVATASSAAGTEFRRGGQPFAVLHGAQISLRLRPDIAEAALRTSGTAPSARGSDWIEFEPGPSDQHDIDRLQAWLTIGWRSAQRHN